MSQSTGCPTYLPGLEGEYTHLIRIRTVRTGQGAVAFDLAPTTLETGASRRNDSAGNGAAIG